MANLPPAPTSAAPPLIPSRTPLRASLRISLWALPCACTAAAQERPPVPPARDVAVTYRVSGAAAQAVPGGVPGALRLFWNPGAQILRVEAEGRSQLVLVDLRARGATVLDGGTRTALVLPMRERDLQALTLDGARLTRRGRDSVAGHACTLYDAQSPRGRGTLCLTADGVPLRGDGEVNGRAGGFVATAVDYGPQPAELFRAPPGYARLDMNRLGLGRFGFGGAN